MKEIIVDLKALDTKEKIHDYFSAVLETPEWYGRNLDALYDELTSITEETIVKIQNSENDISVYTKGLLDVLRDAASENHKLAIRL